MQSRTPFFDDLSKLMTSAAGVAQGARAEAETAARSLMERWVADAKLVNREEFEAVREMAQIARDENAALRSELDALRARLDALEDRAG